MERYSATTTFVVLFTVFALSVTAFTMPMIAGLYVVGDLGGSNFTAIYVVSLYGIGNALGIPLGRAVSQKIGVVRLLCISTALFGFWTLLCALAPNYQMLILFRFFQGLSCGPIFILVNQLLSALGTRENKSTFTSISMIIFTVGPPFGACMGGWLAYDYNWRFLFHLDAVLLPILALLIGLRLRGYQPPIVIKPFDGVGYFFYAVSVCSLGFALTTGQEFDWFRSPMITTLFLVGVPSLIFFILRCFYCPFALFHLKLFKSVLFSFGALSLVLLFATYFGTIILLAFWLHLYVNYTPIWIGLILGIMVLIGGVPGYFLRKETANIDVRIPLGISIMFLAISSFYTTTFDVDINFGRIATSRVSAGLSLVFFLPSVFRILYGITPVQKSIDVLAIFQVLRVLSSSLGAALFLILFQRRQVFYYDRMGSKLSVFSQQTHDFFAKAKEVFLVGLPADAKLGDYLSRRATSLALDDCFYLMGWLMIALLVVLASTFLLRYNPRSKDNLVINIFPIRRSMDPKMD